MARRPSTEQIECISLRFNSLALAVGDLSAMTCWYQTILGLRCVGRGRFDAVGADYELLSGGGCTVELICRPAESHVPVDRTPPPYHLERLGWKALVLETDDLPAFSRALEGTPTELIWDQAQVAPGRISTMLRDPEGNLVHVLQSR